MTGCSTQAPVEPRWLLPRKVRDDLWMICEPGLVTSWLLQGSERAVLVDTGTGFERIRPVADSIASTPITVVNSHHHVDHVGGNREFEEVLIHSSGRSLLGERPHPALVEGMRGLARSAWSTVSPHLGDGLLDFIAPEDLPRRPPDSIDDAALGDAPGAPAAVLEHGDEIDLGDRLLRVLHTPGHSRDSICLLEPDHGLLFAGDTLDPAALLVQYSDSSLEAYIDSVRRLGELRASFGLLLCAHSGHANGELSLIEDALRALETVAGDEAEFDEITDWTGASVLQATVGRLTVEVAPPGGSSVSSVVNDGER